jgi:L-aminopeptidase/D-esterase-like protein
MMTMKSRLSLMALAFALGAMPALSQTPAPKLNPPYSQADLKPVVNTGGEVMNFDWPMLKIGMAEYSEGPTGVTVIRFGRKVLGAVDVRGGGPGTVNTEYLDLFYNVPEVDSVVFSGGSWYGLESVTAVNTALKDEGTRSGHWDNIGLAVGSIIYDFGDRRLNEIYPDKKLAQAAFHAAETGVFRNGSAGAGRNTRTGYYFGCNSASGQGGAFKQVGDIKIAAFTVVNAFGVVADRDGKVQACYGGEGWPKDLMVKDLMQNLPDSQKPGWTVPGGPKRNTTVSLIVVNQKMDPAELKRLAVQVHTSMARGIQPYATMGDGDVMYAISTAEVDTPEGMTNPQLGGIASEVMWDAILNSVPEQPSLPVVTSAPQVTEKAIKAYAGDYRFSNIVSVKVTADGGKLYAQATGERRAYGITKEAKAELIPYKDGVFMVPGRYPTVLDFTTKGKLVMNPGQWQQTAVKK